MKVDVSECIIDLLHNGSKVGLPGIGGLYVKKSSAEIKNDKIYPPHRSIFFTENEVDSDALIGMIKRRYQVTKGTAENVVKKFSQILISKLVNFNLVNIPNVGAFSNSQKGKFRFEEHKNIVNTSKELLPVFSLQKIAIADTSPVDPFKNGNNKSKTKIASPENTTNLAATASNSVKAIPNPSTKEKPVTDTFNKEQPANAYHATSYLTQITNEEEKPAWRTYFWPVLLLLLLALSLIFGIRKCSSWVNGKTDKEVAYVDENASTGDESNSDSNGLESAASITEYDLNDIENIPKSVFANGCTIIVGSYSKSRNALNMISRLKRMGYDTYKAFNDSGMTRVGIQIACDPDDFESIIQMIRSEIEPTSWSLKPRIKVEY